MIRSLDENTNLTLEEYDELAAIESQIWAERLTNPRRLQVINEDKQAAQELGLNRENLSIIKYFKERQITFEYGLSLGCGAGRAEREFLKARLCQKFDAIDISEGAIAKATAVAEADVLPIYYSVQDLNFCLLEENKYDLVLAQTFLHHIINLEYLRDEIYKSLKPNGLLYINDFMGEARFQWHEKRLEYVNKILDVLPESYRYNYLRENTIKQIERPDGDKLKSPFESIRSDEIIPIFLEKFDVVDAVKPMLL
ncbi:MAG: class I SAM-dependent methyltransferase [Deinococcales bacterium]